ncbi:ACP S-malonyltransferase, partial [Candidatus Pelagibacter sp.]|nr:ACP S-malonyltransferase [Candidatus Pelagibacter sp.]
MFSVIFPGQGSQIVGMGKDFFEQHEIVKKLFKEADETLEFSLSKLILEGPKDELDLTINTQPAIFLISYSIFQVVKEDFNINLNEAKYFAGHSLGEYSALSCAGYLNFNETIKTLRVRGDAMQNSVPKGEGGMLAVLGLKIEDLEKILQDNQNNFNAQIANDNSDGQIVLSGKTKDLQILSEFLKDKKIKNLK